LFNNPNKTSSAASAVHDPDPVSTNGIILIQFTHEVRANNRCGQVNTESGCEWNRLVVHYLIFAYISFSVLAVDATLLHKEDFFEIKDLVRVAVSIVQHVPFCPGLFAAAG